MLGRNIELFLDKCRDAFVACAFMMVQGNLLALSYDIICTALITGFLVGIFAVGTSIFEFFTFGKNEWLEAWMIGILTMMADMIVHSSGVGNVFYAEAALTGLGAAIVFIIARRIKTKL